MDANTFRLEIAWDTDNAQGNAFEATSGRGTLTVGGRCIWRNVHCHWCDFLTHLAERWHFLRFEQDYPGGFSPAFPHLLRRDAQAEWDMRQRAGVLSDDDREAEEEAVFYFEERHNLAAAFGGADLAPVYVLRKGPNFLLSGPTFGGISVPERAFWSTLEAAAETIVARLAPLDDDEARSRLAGWQARHRRPTLQLVANAVGAFPDYVAKLTEGKPFSPGLWGLTESQFEENEFLAAARMGRQVQLKPESVSRVLDWFRQQPKLSTTILDGWSDRALAFLGSDRAAGTDNPAERGRALAAWLRRESGTTATVRLEPKEFLRQWGVLVADIVLDEPEVDAMGCWGKHHGPAVFLNTRSQRNRRIGAQRAALAHEMCHLLVDRNDAYPFADLIAGHVRDDAEKRARAFAAEFLLPRAAFDTGHPPSTDGLGLFVEELARQYEVSEEIAAWQIHRSAWNGRLGRNCLDVLRGYVSNPDGLDRD